MIYKEQINECTKEASKVIDIYKSLEELESCLEKQEYKLDVLEQIIPRIYEEFQKVSENQCKIITILKKLANN